MSHLYKCDMVLGYARHISCLSLTWVFCGLERGSLFTMLICSARHRSEYHLCLTES